MVIRLTDPRCFVISEDTSTKRSLPFVLKFLSGLNEGSQRLISSFVGLYADENGASGTEMGALMSFRNLFAFIGQQTFGKASDVFGRAIVLLLGFIVAVVASLMFIGTSDPIIIILILALFSLGFSAIEPAFFALVGDSCSEEERSKMLGAITSAGTIIGGLFFLSAGLLADRSDNPYRIVFLISAICMLVAAATVIAVWVFRLVPPQKPVTKERRPLFEPLRSRDFRVLIIADAIYMFTLSLAWPLFPVIENKLASPAEITYIWSMNIATVALGAFVAARLLTKLNSYRKVFLLSRMPMFTVPLGFAFATHWSHLMYARIAAGACLGFYLVAQRNYVLSVAGPEKRGWFLGTYALILGIVTFVGSLAAGFCSDLYLNHVTDEAVAYQHLFLMVAGTRVLAGLGYFAITRDVSELGGDLTRLSEDVSFGSLPLPVFAFLFARTGEEQTLAKQERTDGEAQIVCPYCNKSFEAKWLVRETAESNKCPECGVSCIFVGDTSK